MPGGFSNFTEDRVLEHIFIEDYVAPDNIYVGLCTADPTDVGTGATCFELPDEDNYARVETTPNDWILSGSTAGILYNKNAIEFNMPSGDWGPVTHFTILDSGTYGEGNMIVYGPLDPSPVELLQGSIPRFSAYTMVIMLG